MKKEWILVPATCLALIVASAAEAQGASKIRRNGPQLRINKSRTPALARSQTVRGLAPRSAIGARRPTTRPSIGSAIPRGNSVPNLRGFNRGGAPNLGAAGLGNGLGRGGAFGRNGSGGPLGGLLQQYLYNEYGGGYRYDPYAGEKAHAKAYRDAAIANAVVNMVGIIATNHQQRKYTNCSTAVAPSGHIERQRILVQEGRTEEYQVWVPQYTVPATGEVVLGHNETRRREIAPVYENREVWIPTP
jgi:hypothetical protein